MPSTVAKFLLTLSAFLVYSQTAVQSFPHSQSNSTEAAAAGLGTGTGADVGVGVGAVKQGDLMLVEQIVTCCIEIVKNVTFDELSKSAECNDSSEAIESVDDLIFLTKKPQKIAINIQNTSNTYTVGVKAGGVDGGGREIDGAVIDLLTAAEEDRLASASASTSTSTSEEEYDGSGVPREIELRIDSNNAHTSVAASATTKSDSATAATVASKSKPRIDMSDFVALIPAAAVKSIAANYYRNDPEVQRAYAYLNSADFKALKQHIIELPEMSAFLRYLNNSGLDLVHFLYTLTNLTSNHAMLSMQIDAQNVGDNVIVDNQVAATAREMEQENIVAIIAATTTTTLSEISESTTSKEEKQLHGLHGLVDSILNILPQDEILATFFDKLETNEQFSALVDSISSPAFAKILHDLQNSLPLRNLIFTLHNNGIYITRIVDSLKAYFFLGTF